MEAILSPLRPLSMTTAKRSPPSAVAERPSLTKVSAVKHAPPCETMDHTRPFQLSLISRWRGPRLLPENRPRRMLLKLLSPILNILPIGGPINEIVNLHSNDVGAISTKKRLK